MTETLEFMQRLWALVHALERVSKNMVREVGVTGPQRLVLRVVGLAPNLSAGQLAAVLHVHPSTLTGVLSRLVGQRLITRSAHPQDRRRAVLALTPLGAHNNNIRRGTVEAAVAAALEGVRDTDRSVAMRVVLRLTEHLERGVNGQRKARRKRPAG